MTKTTTNLINEWQTAKNDLQKQINAVSSQKVNKDTYMNPYDTTTNTGGYYNYVQHLDELNEDLKKKIRYEYSVAEATLPDGGSVADILTDKYKTAEVLTVENMKDNKNVVDETCADTHAKMRRMNTLQSYEKNINGLSNALGKCVEYINNDAKFDTVNWQVEEENVNA